MMPATLIEADDLARQYNPDVTVARLTVDAAMQQFSALMASVKPTVAFSLNATGRWRRVRIDRPFSAQLKLSSPLMPTGSIRAKSRSLSASLEAARFDKDNALRSSALAVRNAFRNLETARSHRAAVAAELTASRLVATGITNEFQFGQKTTLDVLDAEQDVIDAELREVSAGHAILMAAFRLRAASGMLSAESFSLDDVLGPLETMQPIEPRYKLGAPECRMARGRGDVGGCRRRGCGRRRCETEETSLALPVEEPEPVEVAETAALIQIDDAGTTVAGNDGIVWDIRTNQP